MSNQYSRRSFLSGVLASGTVSAGAIYLMPGGRARQPDPEVTLRLVTGQDPTGARDVLIGMWRQVDPRTHVELVTISSGSGTERLEMLSKARAGEADILNLDVIDIPEFADKRIITPVPLPDNGSFLGPALKVSQVEGDPDRYWAVPFNTDVGMLFSRRVGGADAPDLPLPEVLARVTAGPDVLVAQLDPVAPRNQEAFVVNVLEHALAVDPSILSPEGVVSYDLGAWQRALTPLRAAIATGRVVRTGNEDDSRAEFVEGRLTPRFMRNWPSRYRGLQRLVDVDQLPVGVLGGQSLAVAAGSPYADRARRLITFLTSEPAQKVLAAYGLAPSLIAAYGAEELTALVPHLGKVRDAVENSVLRPRSRRYRDFAAVVRRHTGLFLVDGVDLSRDFVEEMRAALS